LPGASRVLNTGFGCGALHPASGLRDTRDSTIADRSCRQDDCVHTIASLLRNPRNGGGVSVRGVPSGSRTRLLAVPGVFVWEMVA